MVEIALTILHFVPQGNNEVGLWNMESQFRQLALWASAAPILSKDRVRKTQRQRRISPDLLFLKISLPH